MSKREEDQVWIQHQQLSIQQLMKAIDAVKVRSGRQICPELARKILTAKDQETAVNLAYTNINPGTKSLAKLIVNLLQLEYGETALTLAQSMDKVTEALMAIRRSGLNDKAIVTLISADTGIAKKSVLAVMNSMATLKKNYTQHDESKNR